MNDTADIYLDGKPYKVNLATYQGKDIIDFAPRASVPNGSVFMSDLSLYQPLVQTDWRHGFGFHWYVDSAGYMRTVGNIDTRQNGLAMLFTAAVTADTQNFVKEGFVNFAGVLWSYGLGGLKKWVSGTTWTTVIATAVTLALPAGDYMFILSTNRIQKMTAAEVVTDAGADANSTDFHWAIIHNGYIYAGKRNTNQIHYDSNADLSQLEGTTADPGTIYCGLGNIPTLGAIVYAGQLYVARHDGLWLIGEDKVARNVLDYSDTYSADNFRSMAVINGLLVFAIRDRIVQWNGARVSDITPERLTDVFPFVTYGRFDNFMVFDNFLFCTARTNETTYTESLICWDGVGWHKLLDQVTNGADIVTAMDYDVIHGYIWYHVQATADVTYYIPTQAQSSLPYAAFPTTGTHSLITSRMDMGFRQVKKSMQSLNVEVQNVNATRYVRVYYSLDGASWVFWADVKNNGITELEFPGGFRTIEFNYALLRFDFITDTATQSPVLESYTLRFIMRPDVRWGYSFDIISSMNPEIEGMQDERTAAEIKADIRLVRDSKAPVAFIGLAGEEVYGYLTSVKEQPVYRTLSPDGSGEAYLEFVLSCNLVQMI
jgi:hypothetical protein